MTEILTESFCERCGTRYTFEAVAGRSRPLTTLGTLGRGLKHFVAIPEASLDEAFAVARSENEQKTTSSQLEAFHRTFNFCLSCRQYTCADCWNGVEGRCQSCSPLPEAPPEERAQAHIEAEAAVVPEDSAAAFTDLESPEAAELEGEAQSEVDAEFPTDSWVFAPETQAVEAQAPEPELEPEPEPEPVMVAEPEPEAEAEAAFVEAEPVAAVAEAPFVGRSLDEEIAAYELRIAALAAAPPAMPLLDPMPELPQPPMAPPESWVEPRADTPVPRPVAAAPADTASPVRERHRSARQANTSAGAALLANLSAGDPAIGPGACRSCGLSLSSSARFCRRCGTPQQVQV